MDRASYRWPLIAKRWADFGESMQIRFLTLRPSRDGHGYKPDCPAGTGFLLLADAPKSGWGIYEVHVDETDEGWCPTLVDSRLDALVRSGMRLSPVLALARDDMSRQFAHHVPSREEFAAAYAAALESRLGDQGHTRWVLAKSLRDEAVDLARGEWYWVLRIAGSPPVAYWVSDDYFVYQTEADAFELTEEQRRRLSIGESA